MSKRIWLFKDGTFHVGHGGLYDTPADFKAKRHKCLYKDPSGQWYQLSNLRESRKIDPPKDIEMRLLLLGIPNE